MYDDSGIHEDSLLSDPVCMTMFQATIRVNVCYYNDPVFINENAEVQIQIKLPSQKCNSKGRELNLGMFFSFSL